MNSWNALPAWKFESLGDGKYKLVCKGETAITAGVEFKLADMDWNRLNYGSSSPINVVSLHEYEILGSSAANHLEYNGDNIFLPVNFSGTIYLSIDHSDLKKGAEAVLVNDVSEANVYFNLNDVSDSDLTGGQWIEESLNADGSVKSAKHYEPVQTLSIDGYTFTLKLTNDKGTAPAFYYSPSTAAADKAQKTLRAYKYTDLT
ncbi:MAG: hypothetical protein K2L73_06840, partial [Muribaculaceae bacterium]|nr:hypothetical protein [Muribaculaceae bacterium]